MIKKWTSERRYVNDTFLGITCRGMKEAFYYEYETVICDICGKKQEETKDVTEYLHIPDIRKRSGGITGEYVREYQWGYKKTVFHACDSHSEKELDAYVEKVKAQP